VSGELVTATVELFYSGVWNDISADVRTTSPINIDRGVANQADGGVADPAGLTLVLNNGLSKVNTSVSNRYSPRNPMSDLFGLIGANTPIRVSAGLVGDTPTVRTVQEVVSWPPRSDVSQNDLWVPVEAAGILRRLGVPSRPLQDSVARFVAVSPPTGYWPMSDLAGSTSAASGVGGQPLRFAATSSAIDVRPEFGQGTLHPHLPTPMTVPSLTAVSMVHIGALSASVGGAAAGSFAVDFLRRRGDLPNPDTLPQRLRVDIDAWDAVDVLHKWSVVLFQNSGDPAAQVAFRRAGVLQFTDLNNAVPAVFDPSTHHFRFQVDDESGTDARMRIMVDGVTVVDITDDASAATLPALSQVTVEWSSLTVDDLGGVDVGQLLVWTGAIPDVADVMAAYNGHAGETAGRRVERQCDERDVAFTSTGDLDESAPMGAQYPGSFLEVIGACAKVEAAGSRAPILVEQRSALGLHFNTLSSLYLPRDPDLTLDFAAGQLSPPVDPTPDDLGMVNDATAERRDGGSARAQVTGGPRGITAAGRVDRGETFDALGDGNLGEIAAWWVHHGTWDEDRYPMLRTNLRGLSTRTDGAALVAAVQTLDPDGLIVIRNTPLWISAEDVSQLVLGLTESIHTDEWLIDAHTTPALPFAVPTVADDEGYQILGSDAAVTAEALDTTETGVDINCGAGPDWVHETDFDIVIGGERMTVTAVAAMAGTFPARTTTLTVTRSVNGIVKSHATAAAITFHRRAYVGAWG
jgi:hypothetical protein